ncbi:Uncharacterized protein SCF082_LOCUS26693 [Durusdinium trenchii]|uniref:C2 NT-type domain-containing protein n=1 Tax=Durusdinium trenchii TaxID=1381693 RepID=A0ABP0M9A9_9DINO
MEIGLELLNLRFHRPGCYRLAVLAWANLSGEQHRRNFAAYVSGLSEISMTPKWSAKGWRLQVPKGKDLEVQLRFYDGFVQDKSHDARSVLDATPKSRCNFHVEAHTLEERFPSAHVLSAPMFQPRDEASEEDLWEEIGVVTLSICLPISSYVELVTPEKLQVSSGYQSFAALTQLEKLRSMNQQERKSLQFVATRLSAMQQCLNACSAHHSELWTEQESQLAEMNELEQKLKHLQEPYLTDLDFELMLSMSTGAQQISQLLLGAEQRWRNAREEVIARWAEYTSLREKLGEVKQVEQHLKEFQLVRTEQRKVMLEASKRAKMAQEAAATCTTQAKMIEELKLRSNECSSRLKPAELQLIHCKEQRVHDVLQEKSEQLSLMIRPRPRDEAEVPEESRLVETLASKVYQRTQRVMELLSEVSRLQRAAAPDGPPARRSVRVVSDVAPRAPRTSGEAAPLHVRRESPDPVESEGRNVLDDAVQAMVAAQLRCEDLERRSASVEEQLLRRQGGSWGQELGTLKAELQRKTVLLSQLERSLGLVTA